MTLLDVLLRATPTLTTMTANVATTTTTAADKQGNVNSTGATTILTYTTSVLGSIDVPEKIVIVQDSLSYVESMSNEELNRLENLLLDQQLSFEIEGKQNNSEELPKVYTKK